MSDYHLNDPSAKMRFPLDHAPAPYQRTPRYIWLSEWLLSYHMQQARKTQEAAETAERQSQLKDIKPNT